MIARGFAWLIVAGATLGSVGTTVAAEIGAKQLYEMRCAFCHGPQGRGDGPAGLALKPAPTNFASAEYWKQASAERVRAAILDGKPGTAMVPFRTTLQPAEIDALVAYVRQFAPK
jgi:high-affinity iron transporter